MEQKFDEGKEIEKEEGEKIGIAKTAKKLLKEGLDVQFIHKITGLTVEEINSL